jgi:spermidine synthase
LKSAFVLQPLQLKTDHRTVRLIQGEREQSVWRKDQPEYLVHSYVQLIAQALLTWDGYPLRNRGRALIIGLGGGILCRFLQKHFPNVLIEVVEPNAQVVKYAHEDFELDRRVFVHSTDGRSHMSTRTGLYDIVIMDAFDETYIPADMMTVDFLRLVKKRLRPNGILISNTWVLPEITLMENATYTEVFEYFWDFRVVPNSDGNRIILVNDYAPPKAEGVGQMVFERARFIDARSDRAALLAKPGARRMLSYEEMVNRLSIERVDRSAGGVVLTDANIAVIRAKASFDN